jgi:hypothetical protein
MTRTDRSQDRMKRFLVASVGAGCVALAGNASASLIYTGSPITLPGGVGSSSTVLTLQSPGNATFEAGVVAPSGRSGNVLAGANTPFPLQTLSQGNVTKASDLVIYWDVQEPGGNSIKLESLVLNIFGPTGNDSLLFSASLAGTLTFDATFPGQGHNPVFAFVLDAAQAAIAQQSFSPLNRVGLSASASEATGGPDRFLFSSTAPSVLAVSEPGVLALLGLAIVGIGLTRARAR